MKNNIAAIRKDYMLHALNESDVDKDPFTQFGVWWNDAAQCEIDEINAMTLSTSSKEGKPSARIVLLKGYTNEGFIFFTNYNSHKGKELEENPYAALVFFWKELERQIRIEGSVEKISEQESADYFFSRPVASQIGAWASPQSEKIESRQVLENNVLKYQQQFEHAPLTKPPHWGGFIVKPNLFEFWQGRSSRLHDRMLYTLNNQQWEISRLAP